MQIYTYMYLRNVYLYIIYIFIYILSAQRIQYLQQEQNDLLVYSTFLYEPKLYCTLIIKHHVVSKIIVRHLRV